MGKNFRETLNKQMANPEFKAEYDALEPEFQIIQAIVDARNRSGLTQKQLSEKTGICTGRYQQIGKTATLTHRSEHSNASLPVWV